LLANQDSNDGQVFAGFLGSPEFNQLHPEFQTPDPQVKNTLTVQFAYQTLLDRAPSADELAQGVAFLNGGGSVADFVRQVLASPDFTQAAYSNNVQHTVVIYQENWSFDSLYGLFPGADGLQNAADHIPQVDKVTGKPITSLPQPIGPDGKPDPRFPASLPVQPYSLNQYVPPDGKIGDIVHRFFHERSQIDGGKMDMYATWSDNPGEVFGYYNATFLPEGKLAQQYTLDDHLFHSAYGGSFLNHQYLISAQAPVFPNADQITPSSLPVLDANGNLALDANGKIIKDGSVTPVGYGFDKNYAVNTIYSKNLVPSFKNPTDPDLLPSQNDSDPSKPNYIPTIGDELDQKGVSWKWYSGGWDLALTDPPAATANLFQWHHQPFAYYDHYAPGTPGQKAHLQDENNFWADVNANQLPAVSFVKPLGPDNEHPGYAALLQGQEHVASIISALQASPAWANTTVVITYDENGGFWDHVSPPQVDQWGPGTRVPGIVIAPYARRGFVDHTTYETDSILKTIEQTNGLKPLANHDAQAQAMFNSYSFSPTDLLKANHDPALCLPETAVAPDRPLPPGPQPDGTAINPHGWFLTPAGQQVHLGDKPLGMALSPDGKTLVVSNDGQGTQSLQVIDRASGKVVQTIAYAAPEALYVGVAFSPDGSHVYASAGGNSKIRVYDVQGQQLTEKDPILLPKQLDGKDINLFPAGLTVSGDGKTLYVADNLASALSVVDLASQTTTATVPVGHNPYTVVLSHDGHTAYVSNWGEETVSVVDVSGPVPKVGEPIEVGTHPSAMALNPQSSELYVANADSDNVSVIDTATNQVVRTINLAPYPGAKEGSSPNALAVSPDGNLLYVANATNNDVAVIRLDPVEDQDQVLGLIPTAWYPTGVTLSPDGGTLYVLNAKGLGAGPNPDGPNPTKNPESTPDQYIGSMIKGSMSVVDVTDPVQLALYTRQVVQNNGFDEGSKVRVAGQPQEHVIPLRPGDPSPIKHIIYIIKENRTFDQVFGSLGKGNGDPNLNLFGDESAPNQRALAKQFVTLDNFYADSEVSADGWNWATGALANTYVQKNWPSNYSPRNRPYDFEGGNYSTSPGKDPTDAFIWDKLDDAGINFRNYGFRVFGGQVAGDPSTEPRLAAKTDLNFNGYDLSKPDAYANLLGTPQPTRIDEWLKEFNQYVTNENLPRVEFVRLPNDHTAGTKPGSPTPRAYVADNDWALGQLVDAVSHSKYWTSTAIFVVEDDAQDGPDHVDAHRTIAQVISPYTQTGKVDSTFYSQISMLRTMELIAGIGPMTQFDAAATPMLNSFTDTKNLTAYKAIKPAQSILDEKNSSSAPMAQIAQTLDFSTQDRAPEQVLNQMIWKSVKGADSEMPAPQTGFRQVDVPAVDDGGNGG
jgi:acid phosphatase